jgi:HK97 family phage prohead protease
MSETLHRAYLPELEIVRSADGGSGRDVEGILVPYGKRQFIHEGLTEMFAESAFRHQIAAMHRVHFAREHVQLGGSPIGRIMEAREDAKGLRGTMRVSATELGDETLTLIADGVLTELSVGFIPRRDRRLADGTVERTKADLTEIAVVLNGAYGQGAKVLAVRSEQEQDDDEREAARARTEAARRRLAGLLPLPC